jgi:anti-sigma B factor antagonist
VEITTRDAGDVKVIEITGELNTVSTPDAEKVLNKLREDGTKKILINLEKLDFISSSGLRILLATGQELKKTDGEMRVCSLNETVTEVFEFSGFDSLLNVAVDESEALAGF